MNNQTPITYGPFTWTQREAREDIWDVNHPEGMTHFCLKYYGGAPGPGFAGWKLVSGGPFDDAGAYRTWRDAMIGATPYLVRYYQNEAREKLDEALKMINTVSLFTSAMVEELVKIRERV